MNYQQKMFQLMQFDIYLTIKHSQISIVKLASLCVNALCTLMNINKSMKCDVLIHGTENNFIDRFRAA